MAPHPQGRTYITINDTSPLDVSGVARWCGLRGGVCGAFLHLVCSFVHYVVSNCSCAIPNQPGHMWWLPVDGLARCVCFVKPA